MAKLLILEDDTLLNKALTTFLKKNGHEVISCHNATEAYDVLYSNIFDLIISDIMMPDIDGLEFLETIRENDSEIPIIFVTAKEDFKTKQQGYRLGVDDYLVKPVDFDELELKIGAICRRAKIASSKKLVVGKTVLDTDERIATVDSEEVQLSVREFDILFKLLSYPKKTFTRSRLMEEFWDYDSSSSTRTVDVYMTKIRNKFSECDDFEILTVHGLGYKAVIK